MVQFKRKGHTKVYLEWEQPHTRNSHLGYFPLLYPYDFLPPRHPSAWETRKDLTPAWPTLAKTERLHFHFSLSCTGEGSGSPLQYSCLENPRDGSLVACHLWGHTELDTTDVTQQQQLFINPCKWIHPYILASGLTHSLYYSCLLSHNTNMLGSL